MSAPSQIPDSFDDDLVVFKSVAGAEKKPDINSSSATLDDSFDMPLEWTDATNIEHGARSSPPPVVPFVGFKTAGTGQIVSIGEEALKKCRQILGKELSGDEIPAQNTDQQYAGFFTSGTGKIVSVSEEALQKSRLVLDTNERSLDDPNTLERSCVASELTAASTTDNAQNMVSAIPVSSEAEKRPVFAGFTTAGSGKTVAVSKDALKKSKLILESSATDLCDTVLPLEGSGTVKPESLAHVKKLFEGGDSSSLLLSIPTVEGETKSNILGNEQKPVTVSTSTPNRVPIPNGASLFLGGRKQPFVSPLLTRSPLTVSGTSTGAVSVAPGTPILTSGVKRRRPVPSFKSPLLQKGNNVMDGVPTKEQVASPLVKVQLEEKKPRLEVVDADVAEYDSFDDSPSTSIVVEGKADPQLPLAGNLNASSTEARNGTPPVAEVTLQEKKPELESAGSAGTGAALVRKDSFDESPNTSAIFTGDAEPHPPPPVGNPTQHSVEPRTQDVTSEVAVQEMKPRLEPADAGIGLVRKDSFDESLSSTPVPIVIEASASSSVQLEAVASTANVEVPLEEKKHRLESVVQGTPGDQCTSPTTSSRATVPAPVSPSTSIVEIAQVTDERTTFTVKVRICEFNGEPVYKGCTCCKSSFRKGDDGYERCNKCRGTEWNYYFRLRARIADMTGDHWCTFFDAPARRLLGCDAEHIHKLVKYNYDKYLEVLREKCMVFEFLMKIRQRKCNIGGRLIRTWNVEGISPVNPAENMDYLLAKRAQLTGAAQERENVGERNQERNEETKE